MVISLTNTEIDRIIEMAWEDRTPFDAIEAQFGLREKDVIELMRMYITNKAFCRWRKRMTGRNTKHALKRNFTTGRFKCSRQRVISVNKISKR